MPVDAGKKQVSESSPRRATMVDIAGSAGCTERQDNKTDMVLL
jgi:hypothetical protein